MQSIYSSDELMADWRSWKDIIYSHLKQAFWERIEFDSNCWTDEIRVSGNSTVMIIPKIISLTMQVNGKMDATKHKFNGIRSPISIHRSIQDTP